MSEPVERVDRDELSFSRREVMAGSSVVAGAAVAGVMPSSVAAQAGPTNEISGHVDDNEGNAVGNATVIAVPHDTSLDTLVTTTDANGDYIFNESALYAGDNLYHVVARSGSQNNPERSVQNYPFILANGGSAIPDSVVQQNFSTEQSYSNGQTVDPFSDSVGSTDLSASDNPEFDDSALNNGPAVVIDDGSGDGTEDGYNYSNVGRSEPITIIWAFEVTGTASIGTLYRETIDERMFYRADNDQWQLIINGNTGTGGSYLLGDKIVALLVDDTDAVLRVNGTQITSVTSTAGLTIQDSGSFWYSFTDAGRAIPSNAGGVVVHDNRLTGSALTDEEQRVESEFGMDVL